MRRVKEKRKTDRSYDSFIRNDPESTEKLLWWGIGVQKDMNKVNSVGRRVEWSTQWKGKNVNKSSE
jgi:hypothetical protein